MEPEFDFSEALKLLKQGSGVRRTGWNGRGMYIKLYRPPKTDFLQEQFLIMKTADNKFIPWLASQTDLLAEDWCLL